MVHPQQEKEIKIVRDEPRLAKRLDANWWLEGVRSRGGRMIVPGGMVIASPWAALS